MDHCFSLDSLLEEHDSCILPIIQLRHLPDGESEMNLSDALSYSPPLSLDLQFHDSFLFSDLLASYHHEILLPSLFVEMMSSLFDSFHVVLPDLSFDAALDRLVIVP